MQQKHLNITHRWTIIWSGLHIMMWKSYIGADQPLWHICKVCICMDADSSGFFAYVDKMNEVNSSTFEGYSSMPASKKEIIHLWSNKLSKMQFHVKIGNCGMYTVTSHRGGYWFDMPETYKGLQVLWLKKWHRNVPVLLKDNFWFQKLKVSSASVSYPSRKRIYKNCPLGCRNMTLRLSTQWSITQQEDSRTD